MRTVDYLDELAKLTDTGSDYAVAKLLGVSRQWVSHYRRGRTFSDETAVKVAQLLGIPPGIILADMHAERASSDDVATAWRQVAETLKKSAAAVLAVVVMVGSWLGAPSPAEAAPTTSNSGGVYIMSNNGGGLVGLNAPVLPDFQDAQSLPCSPPRVPVGATARHRERRR